MKAVNARPTVESYDNLGFSILILLNIFIIFFFETALLHF